MRTKPLFVGCFVLLGAAGCTPPPVLIAQGFTADRVVRYTIRNTGAKDRNGDSNLYDLSVRLCNQGDDGADQSCKDTVVLTNVYPGSVY